MRASHLRQQHARGRRGMALVAAMVALLVATMIAGNVLRTVVRHHRTVVELERRLQAEWLAEAGLERGRAAWLGNGEYTGEDWSASAGDLGGEASGEVEIRVENGDDGESRLAVRAVHPTQTERRATAERSIRLVRPQEEAE